jgi:predicted phosphodiesterase
MEVIFMKRIVLFSDVHGNITGLNTMFDYIKNLENISHIIGCGDYFGYSAGADEIIDTCKKYNVILLRGGHEELLGIIDRKEDNGKYYDVIYQTHAWLKKWLKDEYYRYIQELPMDITLKLNEKYTLYACHAARGDMESYTCGSDRPIEILRKTYGYYEENVIVYGHYHESHIIPIDNKLLINCASIGGVRKNETLINFTIIEYDDEKISIIQKSLPYDTEEELRLVSERNMQRRQKTS